MKNLILSLMLISFSILINAQKKYTKLWNKVEKLEKDNLPKSALNIVDNIYNKAVNVNNSTQIIKCLLYKSKYALKIEENSQLKIIDTFKKHINNSSFPTKNILSSILANIYWQYFQQNRWKFYNRTHLNNKIKENDFKTWDSKTLFKEIHSYFNNSLSNKKDLQKIDIRKFSDILLIAKNSQEFRPTLYDFLAHRAINFYKNDENNISKPSFMFKLNDESLFDEAKFFADKKLISKDSLSFKLNALKIYQNLILFHLNDKNIKALIDVDVERLNFVKKHSTLKNKNLLILKTLQKSQKVYQKKESSGLYAYQIAEIYHNQASKNNKTFHFKNIDALKICNNIINRFSQSYSAKKCLTLKNKITSESIKIKTESYLPIKKFSKILITYKNINKLYFSIYKISQNKFDELSEIDNISEKTNFINKLTKVNSWVSLIKNEKDYLEHNTEIIIPKLIQGNYLITASTNKKIIDNSYFSFANIQITNLALIQNTVNGKSIYQIVNRNTGENLKNVSVTFNNNHLKNKISLKINKTFITNKNGIFSFNSPKIYGGVRAYVKFGNDFAVFKNIYINRSYKINQEKSRKQIKTFLFTDRSIYRPGQIIYFKGISIEKNNTKSKLKIDTDVEIFLQNSNSQIINQIKLKTNKFGSFSGEFIIPDNGLTGNFSIKTKIGEFENKNFIHVEQYKRPKFKTVFNPIYKLYKINDLVTINGFSKAFSGLNISNAKVVYRVQRKTQYPKWYYWFNPNYTAQNQEITQGETKTDVNGNFNISFKALADKNILEKNNPVFLYEISADVTDINGETRSAYTTVKVGYNTVVGKILIDDVLNKSKKNYIIKIDSKNLNGEFTPISGTIKIYKLIPPSNSLRKRLWNKPDYQTINKKEFKEKFPNDAYNNEDNFINWKKGKLIKIENFNTKKTNEIKLKKIKNWKSGKYVIELESKDKFNQKISDKNFFSVYSINDNLPPDNQLVSVYTNKDTYKVGDNAKITFSSNSKDITIVVFIHKKNKITKTQYINLNKSNKTISIPVLNDDLGGFGISYYYINYNSFKTKKLNIDVPYPKTNLEIITKTFKDKLIPGENQTWSFKIKTKTKNIIKAEFLASMYDRSLDNLFKHNWSFNPLYKPLYMFYNDVNANSSFSNNYFTPIITKKKNYVLSNQQYDKLNWFGFYYREFNYRRKFYQSMNDKLTSSIPVKKGIENEPLNLSMSYKKNDVEVHKTNDHTNNNLLFNKILIRKNFNETAFFYPHLKTDKNGDITFKFKVPEALTSWKLQLLGYTKNLYSSTKILEAVTQKKLMITPNIPRFLRSGDKIIISTKISNLSNKNLQGFSKIILTDPITKKEIYLSENSKNIQPFSINSGKNSTVSWKLSIPNNINAIKYKIVAKADNFSDGEQNIIPVLSDKILITETLPLWINYKKNKKFVFSKLKNNNSSSLKNHKLTLEISSNPSWYAIQALPYLMESSLESSEQIFSRYYANTLASYIANISPRIEEIFNLWKSSDALISNLEKNQELKSIVINETPWIRDAQSETQQKKRIALLFDFNKIKYDQQKSINKLNQMQLKNGGFSWFKGSYYPNIFITQNIVTGFGHLKQLGISNLDKSMTKIIHKAIGFLDDNLTNTYKKLLKQAEKIKKNEGEKNNKKFWDKKHINYSQLEYLYIRSFYNNIPISKINKKAITYFTKQSAQYWNKFNIYGKGLIALIQKRNNNALVAKKIINSLRENSISSNELGMYWKSNITSYNNHQAPIETQSLLIEAFTEIENDIKTINKLKVWLLKNKQVSRWKTNKATSQAIYALLLKGDNWISKTELPEIKIGKNIIYPTKKTNIEAGTGYFKTSWQESQITPQMSEVTIKAKNNSNIWGGLYWQYFEKINNISSSKTNIQVKKKLFKKINTNSGKKLIEISEKTKLNIGDIITIRIEIHTNRNMEFIHMKDMIASGLEPINIISKYKWQNGVGYYESIKDSSTNFFFDNLAKGIYIFEYDVRANNVGVFSSGITTIENMYAPEFKSHSKGIKITIN